MLVILHGAPGATPCETVLDEELITEIVGGDLIAEVLLAIDIRQTCGGLNYSMTIFLTVPNIRIVKWIDVDS